MKRAEALAKLQATIASGRAVIGAGAGTGLSAKCAEAGGVDLIIIYNSGRYRMAGRGSLSGMMPYGDANAIVVDMAREVLPVVRETPVLAGVCGTDPFRLMDVFLDELIRIGFSGVQNFPTVGLIDGIFRINLEETGMGYDLEVERSAIAHEQGPADRAVRLRRRERGRDDERRRRRARAAHGPDHEGHDRREHGEDARRVGHARSRRCTTRPSRSTPRSSCSATAARSPSPRTRATCSSARRGVKGFFGASSMERLPTEIAMTENMRRFKALTFNP